MKHSSTKKTIAKHTIAESINTETRQTYMHISPNKKEIINMQRQMKRTL